MYNEKIAMRLGNELHTKNETEIIKIIDKEIGLPELIETKAKGRTTRYLKWYDWATKNKKQLRKVFENVNENNLGIESQHKGKKFLFTKIDFMEV